MFIDSITVSPPAPFEGAEVNPTFYRSSLTPLLRTEPEGFCTGYL